ncbi:MAG: molecular chaperone DnaK [Gammaproteobacteria bacterium]|nr:molecular chaperone DnaK [Gammaproteobacteria bacterium]
MAIIGIDLGTSNSAAATLRAGRPVIIPSAEGVSLGGKAFPSYVALTPDGQMLVGEPARRQAATNPEGTTTAFKRSMGQRKKIMLRDQEFSPEQLSAFLLKKIKQDAEAFLGESVDKAVVTVPAYFDDNQRSSTKDAANIAGIEVARLVNEPTAASLAYGLDRAGQDLRIAVIDFGGGTLDTTIMDFGKGVFEVVSTSGDTHLGGTDMDQRIFEHLADDFKRNKGLDIRDDRNAVARLKEAAEIAKIELSATTTTHITLPYLISAGGQIHHLDVDLTRAELDRLVGPEIERCRGPVEQALKDAHSEPKDIDRIVFVGGPTRMPCVRSFFEGMFGRPAEMGVDPMECVASGAAIQAGVLSGEVGDIVLVDVTPLTLGVETLGGVATSLIARNTPIPVKHTETFSTAADMQTSVTIHVYQGERPMTSDNTSLGQFNLDGLPPAPRGIPKIDVTFDIDPSGILNVTAKDTATGKSQSITISGSTRLSDEEKDRMIKDAERYAEEDKKRRAQADQLNAADSTCYAAEKMLAEFSDKLTDDLRQRVETGLRTTREAVTSRNAEQATERAAALEKDLKEAGVVIYAQSKESGPYAETKVPDGSNSSSSGTHQRVVDAEYQDSKPS